ncbi:MAG: hypothetical protein IJL59_01070, partial [Clostridia bacterium]|nr:hypothetical protein [Clostridia bacterium]
MSRRDRTRKVQPRFLLFLASVFILLISITLLIVAIVYGSSFCSPTNCGGSPDALTLGSTVIPTVDETQPNVTNVESSAANVIDPPPALQSDITY